MTIRAIVSIIAKIFYLKRPYTKPIGRALISIQSKGAVEKAIAEREMR